MTAQQHAWARTLGEQARRAGKSRQANPYRNGSSSDLRALHTAWEEGWIAADMERRSRR